MAQSRLLAPLERPDHLSARYRDFTGAFPWLVLALTRSPFQAGLVGALRLLPYFLFGLPAGALVDRWDRKRVMLLCDLGRAISLASIRWRSRLGISPSSS
ncbi:MFS transporter [Dictyobacter kobayashii]|uniref:MFS transporter n=1 Tax=Dictyobacter kobayashii TaxID=2014872 RepID=UPI000F842F5F|nr:MFS transporter [Dictyobacter kobayashii]